MRTLILGAISLATVAGAQPSNGTFIIMSSNDVSPAAPTTTVSVYAAWDQPGAPGTINSFAFGHGDYDLVAGDGEFTSATLILGMTPPGHPGTPNGPRIDRALIGQVVIPGVMVRIDNPILLAEYEWTTTDFTSRSVELTSENTSAFAVWPFVGGSSIDLVARGQFTPGAGSITVIPTAPTLALLGACALLTARRRR